MARPFSDKPSNFVLCRFKLHAWQEVEPDTDYKSRTPGEIVWWQCARCETERIEVWNKVTGELLYSHYRHPANYSIGNKVYEEFGRGGVFSQARLEYMGRKTGKYQQRSPRTRNGK